jgi:exopolyphosphatase
LDFLIDKASSENSSSSFADSIQRFAEDRKLDVFAIMTTFVTEDDKFSRELLVYASSHSAIPSVERFEKNNSSDLSLEAWSGRNIGHIMGQKVRVWVQKETAASRKQVAPLLRKSIEQS